MSRRGRFLLFLSLLTADALGLVLAFALAHLFTIAPTWLHGPTLAAAALGLLPWLVAFAALHLYDLDTVLEDSQEYATVATGNTYGIILLIVCSTLAGNGSLPLSWVLASWALSILSVSAGRFTMRRVVRAMRRRGHLMASALIVGADEQGRAIARQLKSEADSGLRVLGFVDDFLPPDTAVQDDLRVIGHPSQLPALVAQHHIAEVVVVPGALAWESLQQILWQITLAEGPRIRLSPGYYDLLATTPRVAHRNFVPLFVVDAARLRGFDALLKFGLDYGLGLSLALLTLPLVLLIRRWPGQHRLITEDYVGIGGRPFRAYLWQTASPDHWLTRTGLYRLPLLWAVLLGHMSLIGPRPLRASERDNYRRWLPTLASVRPGVSGPWAVVPIAAREEEMRAALYYIRNWTIWLDLQIAVQTAIVTLRQKWGLLK
jgi:hypothetical protein